MISENKLKVTRVNLRTALKDFLHGNPTITIKFQNITCYSQSSEYVTSIGTQSFKYLKKHFSYFYFYFFRLRMLLLFTLSVVVYFFKCYVSLL